MELTQSADGTRIAFERFGDGAPVVVVGGAFSTSAAGAPLAAALGAVGFQGVAVDRRARGGSGDTRPYAPFREAEDLTAVIEAVGGRAAVLGHSSGAVLALFAAGEGAPISHLFLSEPPCHFGVEPTAADLPDRLQALVDEGTPEEAVVLFQREGVGLPDAVIAQIRSSPMFAGLVALAQSVVYDAILTAQVETPTPAMTGVGIPVTILRGEPTFPFLVAAPASPDLHGYGRIPDTPSAAPPPPACLETSRIRAEWRACRPASSSRSGRISPRSRSAGSRARCSLRASAVSGAWTCSASPSSGSSSAWAAA